VCDVCVVSGALCVCASGSLCDCKAQGVGRGNQPGCVMTGGTQRQVSPLGPRTSVLRAASESLQAEGVPWCSVLVTAGVGQCFDGLQLAGWPLGTRWTQR
jgi:hypothetical protein